jgi:hypothetical protein
MRMCFAAGLLLAVMTMGCNRERDKCLKGCHVDSTIAQSKCEVSDDAPTCKKNAVQAEAACKQSCDKAK